MKPHSTVPPRYDDVFMSNEASVSLNPSHLKVSLSHYIRYTRTLISPGPPFTETVLMPEEVTSTTPLSRRIPLTYTLERPEDLTSIFANEPMIETVLVLKAQVRERVI